MDSFAQIETQIGFAALLHSAAKEFSYNYYNYGKLITTRSQVSGYGRSYFRDLYRVLISCRDLMYKYIHVLYICTCINFCLLTILISSCYSLSSNGKKSLPSVYGVKMYGTKRKRKCGGERTENQQMPSFILGKK